MSRRGPKSRPALERMVDKLDRSGPCWVWTGSRNSKGYGQVRGDDGRLTYVHRLTFEAFIGPIPSGYQVDHLCRVRACCRPDHLQAVDPAENTGRGRDARNIRTRRPSRETWRRPSQSTRTSASVST